MAVNPRELTAALKRLFGPFKRLRLVPDREAGGSRLQRRPCTQAHLRHGLLGRISTVRREDIL
jgi:hypothetical protein